MKNNCYRLIFTDGTSQDLSTGSVQDVIVIVHALMVFKALPAKVIKTIYVERFSRWEKVELTENNKQLIKLLSE